MLLGNKRQRKEHDRPEHVMLALTRLRDFMVERGIVEVSMPVYDPNRGKLNPRELYAILHMVFAVSPEFRADMEVSS